MPFRLVSVELREIHTHGWMRIEKVFFTYGYGVVNIFSVKRVFAKTLKNLFSKNDDFHNKKSNGHETFPDDDRQ